MGYPAAGLALGNRKKPANSSLPKMPVLSRIRANNRLTYPRVSD
jgi:hypothetical protein